MKETIIVYGSTSGNCESVANRIAKALGLTSVIKSSDLTGKTVAVFGCGDSCGFSTTFCEAMKTLYDAAKASGANMIGAVSVDGYTYDDSAAVVDGEFVGLALDEDNESDKTDSRISAWVEAIKPQL